MGEPARFAPDTVAVVVPARNAERDLPGFLESLEQSSYSDYRAFLIDDASEDGTRRIVQDWCRATGRGEPLLLQKRHGPPAARNVALRWLISEGFRLVMFHDSDCILEPTTIEAHVAAHARHPDVGIVGGPVRSIYATKIGRADGYASWFTSPPGKPDGPVHRLHLPTCNMSVKLWVFHQTGLLREELATGEDVAFCDSVRQAGIPIWFAQDARCGHKDRNQWLDALQHHYRWGTHTHEVRRSSSSFLRGAVPRSPLVCQLLAIPYAVAFTLLVIGLWVPYDPRVISDTVRIYRMKRAFTRGLVAGARAHRASV
jgi:GT2 family glycosyltransferase